PGESYKHTWTANVSPTAEPGDLTLRVGVPLHRTAADKTWSEPLKLKIVAKEALANPLYAAWKGQEGKTATFTRAETISGGAPIPGGNAARPAATSSVMYALSEINARRAVLKVTRDP